MTIDSELDAGGDDQSGAGDLKQIGTSPLAKDVMKMDAMANHFISQGDMYKFAVCIAIRECLEPSQDARFTTSHSVTELDADGSLAFLVMSYEKTSEPYRLSQKLAESGFRYIRERLEGEETLDDLFG